jgi:hypothetical protein
MVGLIHQNFVLKNLTMEIKIFSNGEPSEIRPLTPPKQINENLNELSKYFPFLVDNMKMISFLEQYMKHGK